MYPVEQIQPGTREYQLFYQEHFARATAVLEANIYNTVKLFFGRVTRPGSGSRSKATA